MTRLRTTAIRITTAAAALALALGPAAAAQAKASCHPNGSQQLAADSYAQVYGLHGQAYACVNATGRRTLLANSTPGADRYALGGRYVGWSSSDPTDPSILPHSIVTVMNLSNHSVNDRWYPLQTNQPVAKIVVISDGAAAWALDPAPGDDTTNALIQGTDRAGHPADQFSDDLPNASVVTSSLHVIRGKTVGWRYSDGTTGSQKLY